MLKSKKKGAAPAAPVQYRAHWLVRLLDRLRNKAGWSQRELSRQVGMSGGWWVQISGFGKLRGLETLERALGLLGWELVARPRKGTEFADIGESEVRDDDN